MNADDETQAAAGWVVIVTPTHSGKWRWGVLDPFGVEVCGGAGYDDEGQALEDGKAELAAHTPAAVIA